MNKKLSKIIRGADGRYLTPEERREILSYTQSVEKRFKVADDVAAREKKAVEYCIEQTRKRFPNFGGFHKDAWAKAFRDVQLTVRQDVQAMMLDDPGSLEDKLLVWLKTILAAFNFTPEFNRTTYTYLKEGFKNLLTAESFQMMEPYFDRNIQILSDFPEPAVPMV